METKEGGQRGAWNRPCLKLGFPKSLCAGLMTAIPGALAPKMGLLPGSPLSVTTNIPKGSWRGGDRGTRTHQEKGRAVCRRGVYTLETPSSLSAGPGCPRNGRGCRHQGRAGLCRHRTPPVLSLRPLRLPLRGLEQGTYAHEKSLCHPLSRPGST